MFSLPAALEDELTNRHAVFEEWEFQVHHKDVKILWHLLNRV